MMFTKTLIVVDHDVNVQDLSEVTWVVGNHIDPKRNTIFVDGPVDILDHAAPVMGYGTKIGIDGTQKMAQRRLRVNGRKRLSWTNEPNSMWTLSGIDLGYEG